jgi:Ni/Co efflux regulator RcnB
MTHLRGKRKAVPRLRATEHLLTISRIAAETAEFSRGHRVNPRYRRSLYRQLQSALYFIRRIHAKLTRQID